MKRVLVLVTAVAVLSAACGGSNDGSASTTDAPSTTVTTVAPTTTIAVETTTTVAENPPPVPVVPGADAEVDAIVDLYAVALDSATSYEEKAPLIDDPSGLESTVEAYKAAGESVGGIFLQVTGVAIDDDSAVVTYDLLFGDNAFQTGQAGDAVLNNGQWQVTRDYFCSIMTLARVSCP